MAVGSSLLRSSYSFARLSSSINLDSLLTPRDISLPRVSCSTIRRSHRLVALQANPLCSFGDSDSATAADLNFESPLRIVKYPSHFLRAKNKRIEVFDNKLKKLADEMFDVMYRDDGVGLSAPQVGINVQLMVFRLVDDGKKGQEVVLVNPEVTKYSKKTSFYNEGCLSFPEIYADVERPESVTVDARDGIGAKISFRLSGFPARVFQHEFDHLQVEIPVLPLLYHSRKLNGKRG